MWLMDGYENLMGFDLIGGRTCQNNSSGKGFKIVNGRRYLSVVKVRKSGVQVFIDGKLADEWKTDYHDMSLPNGYSLPTQRTLGLATWDSPTIFYSAKVIEITGVGKRLK